MAALNLLTHQNFGNRADSYLGQMDEAGRLGVQQAIEPQPASRQQQLFADTATKPEFVEIDRHRVRVENCLQFGISEMVSRILKGEFAPWMASRSRC